MIIRYMRRRVITNMINKVAQPPAQTIIILALLFGRRKR